MGIAADRLNKKIEYSILLSFYGGLLTENQRSLVSMYCDEDLSLGEIAEQLSVSRQGVSDSLNRAFDRLNRFEECLEAEKTQFPESATYVDFLLKKKQGL